MAVIERRGQPLPDGHPFKGTRIIFGANQPGSLETPSETQESSSAEPTKNSAPVESNNRPVATTTEEGLMNWAKDARATEPQPKAPSK